MEPCAMAAAQALVLDQAQAAQHCLGRLRRVLAVAALSRQHVHTEDVSRFILAHGTGQLLKFFPTFFRHIGGIFSKGDLSKDARLKCSTTTTGAKRGSSGRFVSAKQISSGIVGLGMPWSSGGPFPRKSIAAPP
jgi:hypothetical protein